MHGKVEPVAHENLLEMEENILYGEQDVEKLEKDATNFKCSTHHTPLTLKRPLIWFFCFLWRLFCERTLYSCLLHETKRLYIIVSSIVPFDAKHEKTLVVSNSPNHSPLDLCGILKFSIDLLYFNFKIWDFMFSPLMQLLIGQLKSFLEVPHLN